MITVKDAVQEYKLMGDDGDPWGACMAWWFSVAGVMFERGLNIPFEWGYSPGMGGPEIEEYIGETARQMSDEDLLRFGNLLARYASFLKQAGRSY